MRMDWNTCPVKEKEDFETPPSDVISQVYSPWSLSVRSCIRRLQEPSEYCISKRLLCESLLPLTYHTTSLTLLSQTQDILTEPSQASAAS